MEIIPHPPDAWWTGVPWWAAFGFMITAMVIASIIAPWIVSYTRNRPSAMRSREEAALASQAALDSQRGTFVAAVQSDRDAARADLSREREERRAEVAALRADYRKADQDRIDGWNRGRGMEVEAHQLWHDLVGVTEAFNVLLSLTQRLIAGTMRNELATERLADFKPKTLPRKVPRLRDVNPKSPHETSYG